MNFLHQNNRNKSKQQMFDMGEENVTFPTRQRYYTEITKCVQYSLQSWGLFHCLWLCNTYSSACNTNSKRHLRNIFFPGSSQCCCIFFISHWCRPTAPQKTKMEWMKKWLSGDEETSSSRKWEQRSNKKLIWMYCGSLALPLILTNESVPLLWLWISLSS